MGRYVDGYVLLVKKKRINDYKKMAEMGAKIWKKHGALDYYECVGDDLNPNMPGMKQLGFNRMAKARPDEAVFFSFIVYKSRAHRDAVNKKVMKEMGSSPDMADICDPKNPPFDMKKFAYGGFKALVQR